MTTNRPNPPPKGGSPSKAAGLTSLPPPPKHPPSNAVTAYHVTDEQGGHLQFAGRKWRPAENI